MEINDTTINSPSADARLLKRVKIGILVMLIVFAGQIFSGTSEYWPLTRWAMYAGVAPVPEQLGRYKLHVTDSTGNRHELGLDNLGFLGRNILLDSFDPSNPARRDLYRTALVERIRLALPGIDITEIAGWQFTYAVEPDVFPPVDIEHPIESTLLGKFPVDLYGEAITSPDANLDLHFGDSLALLAFRVSGQQDVQQCEELFVRTWWRTMSQPPADYHITLVLADETGIGRAQSDSPLSDDLTTHWRATQEQLDRRIVSIPCDLPVGSYNLLVGLYELETVQNLEVTYPDGTPYGQLAYLTTIEIREADPA